MHPQTHIRHVCVDAIRYVRLQEDEKRMGRRETNAVNVKTETCVHGNKNHGFGAGRFSKEELKRKE